MALKINPNYNPSVPGSQQYLLTPDSVVNTTTGQLAGGGNITGVDMTGYTNPNPIVVPPPTVPSTLNQTNTSPAPTITISKAKLDTTNYGGYIDGNNASMDARSKVAFDVLKAQNPQDSDAQLKAMLSNIFAPEPTSNSSLYEQYTGNTLENLNQQKLDQQKAKQEAESRVNAKQAEIGRASCRERV